MPPRRSNLSSKKHKQDNAHYQRYLEGKARRESQQSSSSAASSGHAEGQATPEGEGSEVPSKDAKVVLVASKEVQTESFEIPKVSVEKAKVSVQNVSTQTIVLKQNSGSQTFLYKRHVATQVDVEDLSSYSGSTTIHQVPQQETPISQLVKKMKQCLSPEEWNISCFENNLHIYTINFRVDTVIDKSIVISDNKVEIKAFGVLLKNNHSLMTHIENDSLNNVISFSENLLTLLTEMKKLKVCHCVTDLRCKNVWSKGVFGLRGRIEIDTFTGLEKFRSNHCDVLCESLVCSACHAEQNNMVRQANRQERNKTLVKDASKINLRYIERNELMSALRESRLLNSKYKRSIQLMKEKIAIMIENQGEFLHKSWSTDFKNINKNNFDKMSPLQKLFWDEQMKAASMKDKRSMKWHPMMIRLAVHFQMVSSSAYENVSGSGFVTLPSKRTLYDYTHAIDPKEGCQEEILDDFRLRLETCDEHERFVCLMFDEMHIRSNLVYQKSTGEMVGYAKLTEVETEFEDLMAEWSGTKRKPKMAKKVMAFMIKNISVNDPTKIVKGIVAVYSVPDSITASGVYSRVWEVIYHLETSSIPVLVVTCDGASTNRRFIKLNKRIPGDIVTYRTVNKVADFRMVYFIIDPPHLLKTSRNCFANSYSHKKSRQLWKNGEKISWELIVKHYEDHKDEKFRKALISSAHVYLTSFSLMNVSLAAQVLSKTLASAIESDALKAALEGKPYPCYKEAVVLMIWLNNVFDCLNGHNVNSHLRFRNDYLRPYSSKDDVRFPLLLKFLDYLDEWENEVNDRPGNFSTPDRARMILSDQTRSGWQTTIYGFIGATETLISKGADAVCARRFSQDPLEQAFSVFRQKGGSNNNPDLIEFLKTRVSIHAQKEMALPSSRGNTLVEKEELLIDSTPVPKRKKI